MATRGGERSGLEHSPPAPTAADLGLTRKEIHEARIIRDAEKAEPGIVRRTLHEALSRPARSIRQRPHDSLDALEGNKTLGVTVRYEDALAMV